MQARSANDLLGIDVSHHNGAIDWPRVKAAGVKFAYIKSTEGTTYTDPKFRSNAAGARAAGIKVGFYHYAHAEKNQPYAEAEAFYEATRGVGADLPYCLDLEGESGALSMVSLTAWAITFMREVKRLTGKGVILYTGAYFARDELGKAAGEFPLWIAQYGATIPLANNTWGKWAAFQYTDKGKVDGIAGYVDMDYMDDAYYDSITKKPAAPGVDYEQGAIKWHIDGNGNIFKDGRYIAVTASNSQYIPETVKNVSRDIKGRL
jgi:lysozyme